jgi:FtsP/CotA-like multicopper oxidase with cupredoxin domain
MAKQIGRRDFLRIAGATGVAALGAGSVLANQPHQVNQENAAGGITWQEMDAHHQEAVDKFLANAGKQANFWGEDMPFEMDGDVKVFKITCKEVDWEVQPDMIVKAMTYNGVVPGQTIRVTEGDTVRIIVTNEMTQSTAIHYHGLIVPNDQDGVPMVTQPAVTPGSTHTYEFTIQDGNIGSHMYHSHHNSAEQTTRGLLGAFIVEPKDKSIEPQYDAEYLLVLNDSGLGTYTFNGKSFPYTQPIVAKKGQRLRLRYMNEGFMIHPMHLHGLPQQVFAKDGFLLPAPYWCDTLNIAPGERYDVIVPCDSTGLWAFHCHILNHAEGPYGMFGMVTVVIVQD